MPLIRRLPKRGFRSPSRIRQVIVNVESLNIFEDGSVVDHKALTERGIVRGRVDVIKVLGQGELKKRIEVVAHAFSTSAKTKIEAAQGTARIAVKAAEDAKPEAAKESA